MDAIVADLDGRRHPFHVAIENWQHDMNIGSIVRSANAFLAAEVHIIGRRRWNKRGAMVTDRYQHVRHHEDVAAFAAWADAASLPIIAVDNLPGAVPLDRADLPERCVLLFGQEGPGLSAEALAAASGVVEITQYGSTRSINACGRGAVVMYEWCRRWALSPGAARRRRLVSFGLRRRICRQRVWGASPRPPRVWGAIPPSGRRNSAPTDQIAR